MTPNSHDHLSVNQKWLQSLQDLYSKNGGFSHELLANFYDEDAIFIDPVHQVKGLQAMLVYFHHVYAGLISCRFDFEHHAQTGQDLFISWTMTFRHPQLKRGCEIAVQGSSHIKLNGERINYHRDYYDVGSMLYDNIPLLGRLTLWIKRRLVP